MESAITSAIGVLLNINLTCSFETHRGGVKGAQHVIGSRHFQKHIIHRTTSSMLRSFHATAFSVQSLPYASLVSLVVTGTTTKLSKLIFTTVLATVDRTSSCNTLRVEFAWQSKVLLLCIQSNAAPLPECIVVTPTLTDHPTPLWLLVVSLVS